MNSFIYGIFGFMEERQLFRQGRLVDDGLLHFEMILLHEQHSSLFKDEANPFEWLHTRRPKPPIASIWSANFFGDSTIGSNRA